VRIPIAFVLAGALAAADDPFAPLNLEAHGFASFGYLRSWDTPDWLADDSGDGSTDFWEAAVNATARPMDHLRLGAQIFARDLGRYDNGKPTLDWAYADWRQVDALGIQAGRVRIPLGLYNEVLDVDAARTAAFLPVSVYPLVNRDLFISTDGARVYGYVTMGDAGAFDYSLVAGAKRYDSELAVGTFFQEMGVAEDITEIGIDLGVGAMLHWYTPCEGLGLRISGLDGHGFSVRGISPTIGATAELKVDDYLLGMLSAIYEHGDWTVAAEYARYHATGEITIDPFSLIVPYRDDSDGGYISATWHARPWLELYSAGEASWTDAHDRGGNRILTAVLAVNLMPTPNWSLKVEGRLNRQDYVVGQAESWQGLALKTTVDF